MLTIFSFAAPSFLSIGRAYRHLPLFRDALAQWSAVSTPSGGKVLLLPNLQSLFVNYAYGEDAVLPADDVRTVLSALYADQGKFKIGEIDDAVECLEAILLTIHCESVGVSQLDGGGDTICTPPCPACSAFKVRGAQARPRVRSLLLPGGCPGARGAAAGPGRALPRTLSPSLTLIYHRLSPLSLSTPPSPTSGGVL